MRTGRFARTGTALCVSLAWLSAMAATLPDPTRPYLYTRPLNASALVPGRERVTWHLSGVQIRQDRKRAIVNGRLVQEGDVVDTAKVIEISESEVVLEEERQRVVVRLIEPRIKQPAGEAGDAAVRSGVQK